MARRSWYGRLARKLRAPRGSARKAVRPAPVRPRVETLESRTLLSVFTVFNTFDSGPGSLRQAIFDANANHGLDTIAFDIAGGGVRTIMPSSELPPITDPVIIDGTSQPGYAGTPLIELDGSLAGFFESGLTIEAGNSVVKGLAINHFHDDGIDLMYRGGNVLVGNYIGTDPTGAQAQGNGIGVMIGSDNNLIGGTEAGAGNLISGNGGGIEILGSGATNNSIQGNYIGTDATGTQALGNTTGVDILGGRNNTVGGTATGAGNLISGNSATGLSLGSDGNIVRGNYIGTDVTGARAVGNFNGVSILGEANFVGGTTPGSGNVIAGNGGPGIEIIFVSGNVIQGDYIGTDATGTQALGNGGDGVVLNGSNNTVGGTTAGAGNLIAANGGSGIAIQARGNAVEGNLIGTDISGTNPLGNSMDGVSLLTGASGNTVGGTVAGAGNTIAFNSLSGVLVNQGTDNAIQGNAIFANGGLGIELVDQGNHDQEAPMLIAASSDGQNTTVVGTLTSAPNTDFVLEFFSNTECGLGGYGQGEIFLGSLTVTTDDTGLVEFTAMLDPVDVGQFITATATDPEGNTSQFSNCVAVEDPGRPSRSLGERRGVVGFRSADLSETAPLPIWVGARPTGPQALDLIFSRMDADRAPEGESGSGHLNEIGMALRPVSSEWNPTLLPFSEPIDINGWFSMV